MKAKDHDMAQFAFSEFRKKMDFGTVVASREGFCVRLVCVCVCVCSSLSHDAQECLFYVITTVMCVLTTFACIIVHGAWS